MRVETTALSKRFGAVTALRSVSCEIPPGRRVALVGPNGSGKSTFNRALMGLLRFEGEVRLDGASPCDDRVEIARRIAYVPQAPPQLAVPVGELIAALARIRGIEVGRVDETAARLGLDSRAVARRSFRQLSGGMKQKLLLAFALSADASLLILDEPTGSLDARSRESFFGLFEHLPAETTLLLCSHRLEEVRQLVEHVMLLEDGRLVYDGAASAFLDSSTTSVLEVCVDSERAEHWLREQGFRRGTAGWWIRIVTRAEKRELLAKLMGELAPAVRDLNARDLEWLEVAGENGSPRDEP